MGLVHLVEEEGEGKTKMSDPPPAGMAYRGHAKCC